MPNDLPTQSDESFLRECHPCDSPAAQRIALGARMIVAVHGGVDPQQVHAHHRYPDDLQLLPSWDSLGQVELLLEVEDLIGYRVSDDTWDQLVNWDCFTVQELVCRLVQLCNGSEPRGGKGGGQVQPLGSAG